MANIEDIIGQLKAERDRLDKAIAALASLNGSTRPTGRGRRAASIAKMRASQQARRARERSQKKVASGVRRKRKISAAGRARIRAAQKKRWSKIRAGKK